MSIRIKVVNINKPILFQEVPFFIFKIHLKLKHHKLIKRIVLISHIRKCIFCYCKNKFYRFMEYNIVYNKNLAQNHKRPNNITAYFKCLDKENLEIMLVNAKTTFCFHSLHNL